LIKASDDSAVYSIITNKRYVFPDLKTYQSWHGNVFSNVEVVSLNELSSYGFGGIVTHAPNTIIKVPSDPKVYQVISNSGQIVWIDSAATLSDLYGSNWARQVVDVPEGFFVNYSLVPLGVTGQETIDAVQAIQAAIALYYNDHAIYPLSGGLDLSLELGQDANCLDKSEGYLPIAQCGGENYISPIPPHPEAPKYSYIYTHCTVFSYVLEFYLTQPANGLGVGTHYATESGITSSLDVLQLGCLDVDGDGLTSHEERKLGTNIYRIDTDSDGLSDRDEVITYKTDPLDSDTDDDGFEDGEEISNGYSPFDPAEPDNQVSLPGIRVGEHIRGDFFAPITLIEYADFEDPFSKRHVATLAQILDNYPGQVRVAFRHYPLRSIHPFAQKAAEAAECASEQGKFWEMHDILFANNSALTVPDLKSYAGQIGLDESRFNTCFDSTTNFYKVDDQHNEAVRIGVRGVPATFVNSRLVAGAVPYSDFETIINQELIFLGLLED